jgi:hypothetical protein
MSNVSNSLFTFRKEGNTVTAMFLGHTVATFRDTEQAIREQFALFVQLARGLETHADFWDSSLPTRRSGGKDVKRGALLVDAEGVAQSQVQWSVARRVSQETTIEGKARAMIRLQVSFGAHGMNAVCVKNACLAIAHWELKKLAK